MDEISILVFGQKGAKKAFVGKVIRQESRKKSVGFPSQNVSLI